MSKFFIFCCLFFQFLAVYSIKSVYFLPGAQPESYETEEQLDLYASKLTSSSTHIPLEYSSLPLCSSGNSKKKKNFLEDEVVQEKAYNVRISFSFFTFFS